MQIRIAMVGFAICSVLPRVFRIIRSQVYSDKLYVPLQIRYRDMTVFLTALVDSGNLLKEPITQKPIIVMKSGIWGQPIQSGYPVAYQSVGGNGILFAVSAQSIQVFQQRWHAIDAMITESDSLSQSVDAILPMCLLPKERKGNDALQTEDVDHEAIHPDPILSKKTVALYSFRRNFAGALSGRRGTGVDQSIDDRGSGSKECVD